MIWHFNIFDIFPGCQDHPGTIQDIKLHTNKKFLTQNMMKNYDFSSNVHFRPRLVHSTQNFIIYSEKKIKNIIALILEGFMNNVIFQIFVFFAYFSIIKGPINPYFRPINPYFRPIYPRAQQRTLEPCAKRSASHLGTAC